MKNEEKETKDQRVALRETNAAVLRSVFALVVAIVALGAGGLAWFSQTKAVKAQADSISVSGGPFELATAGELGLFDLSVPEGLPGRQFQTIQDNGEDVAGPVVLYDTSANSTVEWMLTPEQNFSNRQRYDSLTPGSSGKLELYIIPNKTSAALTVNFAIDLKLYDDTPSGGTPSDTLLMDVGQPERSPVPISELSDEFALVKQLASGHILFFENYDGSYYSGWIQSGAFTRTFSAREDVPIKVTIYWIWPKYLDSIWDVTGETGYVNLDEHTICDPASSDYELLKAALFSSTDNAFLTGYEDSFPSPDQEIYASDLISLRSYYNNADYLIGINSRYVILSLKAFGSAA